MFYSNTWNDLALFIQMSSGSFKKMLLNILLQIIYKRKLTLNNPQESICRNTQLKQTRNYNENNSNQ